MKVPEPVRVVFDKFPLYELPAEPANDPASEPVLAVYSLDHDGLPLDPRCLQLYCVLELLGEKPAVKVLSPYITSKETLPVFLNGKTAVTTVTELLKVVGKTELDAETTVYASLLDTWVADAWHETIMSNLPVREHIYGEPTPLPWPFSVFAASQLDEHLDSRHFRAQQGSGDDYVCSAENLHRAAMAFQALDGAIHLPIKGGPSYLDTLIFAYTWPILRVLPESALAQLIPEGLRAHADAVRVYFQ